MSNRKKDWLDKPNKTANRLDPESRAALVREAFTAISDVAFLKWMDNHREDLKSTTLSVAELRERCFKELEIHWPQFQAMSANSTDDRLYAELRDYTKQAEATGLREWRIESSQDQKGPARGHENAVAAEKTCGRER